MGQAAVSCIAKDKDTLDTDMRQMRKQIVKEVRQELHDEMAGLSKKLEKLATEKAEQAAATAVAKSTPLPTQDSGRQCVDLWGQDSNDMGNCEDSSLETERMYEQSWTMPEHPTVPQLRLASLRPALPKSQGTPRSHKPEALTGPSPCWTTRLQSGRGTQRSETSSCAFYRIFSVEAPCTATTTATAYKEHVTVDRALESPLSVASSNPTPDNIVGNSSFRRHGLTARNWHTPRGDAEVQTHACSARLYCATSAVSQAIQADDRFVTSRDQPEVLEPYLHKSAPAMERAVYRGRSAAPAA